MYFFFFDKTRDIGIFVFEIRLFISFLLISFPLNFKSDISFENFIMLFFKLSSRLSNIIFLSNPEYVSAKLGLINAFKNSLIILNSCFDASFSGNCLIFSISCKHCFIFI